MSIIASSGVTLGKGAAVSEAELDAKARELTAVLDRLMNREKLPERVEMQGKLRCRRCDELVASHVPWWVTCDK